MAEYWAAVDILKQVAGELGLPRPSTIVGIDDIQSVQLLSLMNAAGNELVVLEYRARPGGLPAA
jgi:hypothetical protein